MYKTTYDKTVCQTGNRLWCFSRDLKTLLVSHTYEKDIDLLVDD